ncbi:MAG: DUF3363 domain-containing protein [Treponema sp.]|jgi:hypothetical protein|nr:DUF3363 domain-containing protein [Treponema sp.]
MRHFLFEEKEYRIRASFKRRKEIRDAVTELSRLLRSRGTGRSGGRPGADTRQKCIAKMQYSNSLEAHKVQLEHYLAREGTDINGSAAKLFGTDSEVYRNNMAEKNFRIFLSPQSPHVNLKALTEQFVEKLEKQTGYRLYWQGACHYNTAHPHAHLLINGVDKLGREITFPKDMVKTFMRDTARDLCTAQLGRRTGRELAVEQEQELAAPRLTRLDKRIGELCVDGRISLNGGLYDKDRIRVRLAALCNLGLCTYENGGYRMKADWDEDLRTNGRYNAFLKARGNLRYSDPSSLKLYSGGMGEITGRVTKIYRLDEDASDNHALVVEGLDGKAYFIPLFKKPALRDGKMKLVLNEGALVSIKTYGTQQGRLTPFIFKQDLRRARNMVKRGSYTGNLADEVINGPSARQGMT